jgi:hypothetical protein
MKEIILVDIDRDINIDYDISQPDKTGLDYRFFMSFQNLHQDISAWNQMYGLDLSLHKRRALDPNYARSELSNSIQRFIIQVYTCVDQEAEVWFKMIVGDFSPSQTFVHDDERGWCFAWCRF